MMIVLLLQVQIAYILFGEMIHTQLELVGLITCISSTGVPLKRARIHLSFCNGDIVTAIVSISLIRIQKIHLLERCLDILIYGT